MITTYGAFTVPSKMSQQNVRVEMPMMHIYMQFSYRCRVRYHLSAKQCDNLSRSVLVATQMPLENDFN